MTQRAHPPKKQSAILHALPSSLQVARFALTPAHPQERFYKDILGASPIFKTYEESLGKERLHKIFRVLCRSECAMACAKE